MKVRLIFFISLYAGEIMWWSEVEEHEVGMPLEISVYFRRNLCTGSKNNVPIIMGLCFKSVLGSADCS